jgi:hypothetical protein
MEKLVDTHELERELRATLSAQREIGPNYDHQLIENFMQKVHKTNGMPPLNRPSEPNLPNVAMALRMVLAIVSVIFLIPLAAITTANSGLAALFVVSMVVLGINLVFNLNLRR